MPNAVSSTSAAGAAQVSPARKRINPYLSRIPIKMIVMLSGAARGLCGLWTRTGRRREPHSTPRHFPRNPPELNPNGIKYLHQLSNF